MSGLYFCEHRTDRPAFLHAVFATILEWTAMRNIQRAGGLTFDALDLFVLIHMNGKLCPQKSLCIWMKRLFRNILSRDYLHDIPEVHDSNLMGKGTDQSQVMADKKHADVFLLLETYQKPDHGFLYGNVKCRGSLIAHQNLRFQGKCPGNTDTLTLTTTHIMGIAVCKIFRKLYHFQEFSGLGFFFASFQLSVIDQGFCENIHDLHFRVKGRQRILEDHLHVLTVQPGFFFGKIRDVFSMVKDLSAGRFVKRNDHADKG